MTARRIFVALLAILAALDVLILAIRVTDVLAYGRLRPLAAEGPVLYSIWKLRHGYPLYEWPTRPYFALTLYNFLFYDVYAAIFSALRLSDEATVIAGRFVTLAFSAAGALAQYAAGRRLTPRSFRLPLALLCIVTWFGCILPGIWSIGIRPDVPGIALSTAGVAIVLRALQTDRPAWLAAGGAMFLLAWTFKQSQVALFAATCIHVVVWRRSLRELALVAGPFVAGVGLTLAIGGAVYRANVIDAPRVNPLVPYLAIYWYRSVALTDLLLWGVALYAIAALVRPGSVHGPVRSPDGVPERSRQVFGADVTYPALATVAAFAAGSVLMMKIGSSINHILELNVAASLLCAAVLGSAWETPRARALCAAGALMLVPMIAYAAIVLRNQPGPIERVLLLKSQDARLHFSTRTEAELRQGIETLVAGLPRPVYVEDEMFALPWQANGNRYPALALDPVFHDAAKPLGLLGAGVEGLFVDHYFGSAVLTDSSPRLTAAMRAGYRLSLTVPLGDGEPLRVLVRAP